MAELHLPAGQAIPRAVDLIQVQPFTGAATAERVVPPHKRSASAST